MLKAIIFDLAEVCIRGLVGFDKTISQITKIPTKKVRQILTSKKLVKLFEKKLSEKEYWELVLKELKVDIPIEKLKLEIRKHFIDIEYKDTHKLISEIKELRIPLYLHSDHAEEWMEYILVKNSFLQIFTKTFFSFELGSTKLSVDSFKSVLSKINSNGKGILFIDDSIKNLAIAKKAGIRYVEQFTTPKKLRSTLIKKYGLNLNT